MSAVQVSRELYPFESHRFDIGGLGLHYVDEGQGEPLVMVHGNPTWSFYYRRLIGSLKDRYRTIAPDHIGCGMSDKPGDDRYPYTLERRVDDLEALIDSLGLEKVTLVLHDWGGMIGMAWAARHPEKLRRAVIFNTAAFHLPESKRFPWPLWLTRTPLGAGLVRGGNAFSSVASRVCVKRGPMSPEVRRGYVAPYDTWDNRIATLRFVQDIPLRAGDPGYSIVSEVEAGLASMTDRPALICWGMKDFVFDHHFLTRWETLWPQAQVHRFEDCGHYILEDAYTEILPKVETFLEST